MPMRGELTQPELRQYWKSHGGELPWTWRQIHNAVGAIDPIVLWFSGTGLLLSVCQVILDPASADIGRSLAYLF